MANETYLQQTSVQAKEVVISCIEAINEEDFITARKYVSDDMVFRGVLGSRDGAEAYFTDMEKMKLKYEVKKVFVEDNDVCVLYDLTMSSLNNIYGCGWYHVKDDKIVSLKVVFDPRPVLEMKNKN